MTAARWLGGTSRRVISERRNNSALRPTPLQLWGTRLNNLLTVTQSGQSRSFTYDSLSHLLTATNPESGQIQYPYDANGNVTTRIDAAGNTTTYTYDALNRVLTKNYSDTATSRACYAYDEPVATAFGDTTTHAVGHLTSSWSVQDDGTVVAANEEYGSEKWTAKAVRQFGLESTTRSRGRPQKGS